PRAVASGTRPPRNVRRGSARRRRARECRPVRGEQLTPPYHLRLMRIGIVCYPTIGGSGVVATEMAHTLATRGHEVHLLSYDRPSRLRRGLPRLRFHQVQVSAYPLFRYPPYDLALATRLLEVREEANVDLFHVHYAIPHA